MSLIRKHVAVLQAWACLDLVLSFITDKVCIGLLLRQLLVGWLSKV